MAQERSARRAGVSLRTRARSKRSDRGFTGRLERIDWVRVKRKVERVKCRLQSVVSVPTLSCGAGLRVKHHYTRCRSCVAFRTDCAAVRHRGLASRYTAQNGRNGRRDGAMLATFSKMLFVSVGRGQEYLCGQGQCFPLVLRLFIYPTGGFGGTDTPLDVFIKAQKTTNRFN